MHCAGMSEGTMLHSGLSRPAAADVAVGAGLLVVKSFLAHGSSLRLRCVPCNSGLSQQAIVT